MIAAWDKVGEVLLVILGSVGLFILCCGWLLCEEDIKGWWKRRRGKDN